MAKNMQVAKVSIWKKTNMEEGLDSSLDQLTSV